MNMLFLMAQHQSSRSVAHLMIMKVPHLIKHLLKKLHISRIVRKPDFCLGNREADQRLCFRYSDSTIPLLLKSEISSF